MPVEPKGSGELECRLELAGEVLRSWTSGIWDLGFDRTKCSHDYAVEEFFTDMKKRRLTSS